MWLGADIPYRGKKNTSVKEIGFHVYNMLTILGFVVDMIGGYVWSFYSFNTFDFGESYQQQERPSKKKIQGVAKSL
jgi:hypothetical protein